MGENHSNQNRTISHRLNKCAFKDILKLSRGEQVLMSRGSLFQAFGAAIENDISPYVFSLDASPANEDGIDSYMPEH